MKEGQDCDVIACKPYYGHCMFVGDIMTLEFRASKDLNRQKNQG